MRSGHSLPVPSCRCQCYGGLGIGVALKLLREMWLRDYGIAWEGSGYAFGEDGNGVVRLSVSLHLL